MTMFYSNINLKMNEVKMYYVIIRYYGYNIFSGEGLVRQIINRITMLTIDNEIIYTFWKNDTFMYSWTENEMAE